jgi:D-alanyl-D-alanine carboxypeptidase
LGAGGRWFKSGRPDFVRFAVLVLLGAALLSVATASGQTPREPFRGTITRIDGKLAATMTGVSWRPGCPVHLRDLRLLTLSHRRFDGKTQLGRLIVHADVARELVRVFRELYRSGFPIRRMVPVDAYGASDFRSIEADNTSAFNCRAATGSSEWSHHAYGLAIDINPIENPYVLDGRTIHPASEPYLDRDRERPGMLLAGGPAVRAFTDAGWYWGGKWSNPIDYQHFSKLPD